MLMRFSSKTLFWQHDAKIQRTSLAAKQFLTGVLILEFG